MVSPATKKGPGARRSRRRLTVKYGDGDARYIGYSANVSGTGMPVKDLANLLLNEAGVASLWGTAFGQYGDGYLRFSYANSLENILQAIERIKVVSARWS